MKTRAKKEKAKQIKTTFIVNEKEYKQKMNF